MRRWRERLRTFLEARNGIDQIAVFLMGLTLLCLLTGVLLRFPVLPLFGCLILVYLYFRIFSGKKERRRLENMSFLGMWEHLRFRLQVRKMERSLKKTSRYVRCGACGRKYRVSKKKSEDLKTNARSQKRKKMDSVSDSQEKAAERQICCPWCGAIYRPFSHRMARH